MAASTRSLPTNSPVPYFQPIERGPMSEGRLSDMGSIDVAFAADMQMPSRGINLPRAVRLPEGTVPSSCYRIRQINNLYRIT